MSDSHGRSDESPFTVQVPAGAPRWVTPELIEHTLRVWQPYYRDPLIPEDALEMIMGVSRIVDVFSGGDREAIRSPGPREQP